MNQDLPEKSADGVHPAQLRQLLGAPPVLSTERIRSYQEIMGRLMECLAPCDFMEQMFVKELTDCTWEMARYTRQKTLAMERGFRKHLKFPGQDALAAKDTVPLAAQDKAQDIVQDIAQDMAPQKAAGESNSLVDGADAISVELDHAHALEATLGYHERVDRLLITATARRNNVLDQIERYRDGLGYRLRQASDRIIEGEFDAAGAQRRQVAAPLVPCEAQQQ